VRNLEGGKVIGLETYGRLVKFVERGRLDKRTFIVMALKSTGTSWKVLFGEQTAGLSDRITP